MLTDHHMQCTALHCTALHCTALDWNVVQRSLVQCSGAKQLVVIKVPTLTGSIIDSDTCSPIQPLFAINKSVGKS